MSALGAAQCGACTQLTLKTGHKAGYCLSWTAVMLIGCPLALVPVTVAGRQVRARNKVSHDDNLLPALQGSRVLISHKHSVHDIKIT